ncbi:hypothetical protein [Streptococcus sp. zg-JUN1979]|uniref:hypothetical protein n=1 Tax=Streptococcus sp. zg-JUN1979 TaxID=3391450 RepID=UPI0039A5E22B
MVNEVMIKYLKLVAAGVVLLLILLLGLSLAFSKRDHKAKVSSQLSSSYVQEVDLSEPLVVDFLKTYYTTDKVGANRKAYKPFMTQEAYERQIEKEDNPSDKLYTDFMKDFRYQKAKVYLGSKDNVAYATVRYGFIAEAPSGKGDDKTVSRQVTNTIDLKLTYSQTRNEAGQVLIDRIDVVDLSPIQ